MLEEILNYSPLAHTKSSALCRLPVRLQQDAEAGLPIVLRRGVGRNPAPSRRLVSPVPGRLLTTFVIQNSAISRRGCHRCLKPVHHKTTRRIPLRCEETRVFREAKDTLSGRRRTGDKWARANLEG